MTDPAPAPETPPLPTADADFVFKDINSAPAWVDKGWAGYSQGPALQLPRDLSGKPPYTTITARVGDTVYFKAAKGAVPAHFEVIAGDSSLEPGIGTKKQPQVTNASLEDLVKLGNLPVGEMGSDAKAQVADRSPELKDMIEGKVPQPAPQEPASS